MNAIARVVLMVLLLTGAASAEPAVLKLNDGSLIKGEVSPASPTATDVTVTTEFGVVRIPVAKISPESRKAAGIGQPVSPEQYDARIAQLEARIKDLETENARLRRDMAGATSSPARPLPAASGRETGASTPATGLSYSRSSTGKRHNSRCRYFTSGSPCGPSDGIACKICGG